MWGTNIPKVLSRGLYLRGQIGGRSLLFQANQAQRCPFGHYLAKIFMTARVFTTERGTDCSIDGSGPCWGSSEKV
jgi:hypothetical protein